MSSAMLGFSGYEVIPASGKHAARPKWKVISTALTLAAVFLIGTGVVQLYAAQQWRIPATEGYSTLLIEYEIIAAQSLGNGVSETEVARPTTADFEAAEELYLERLAEAALVGPLAGEEALPEAESIAGEERIESLAKSIALGRQSSAATQGTPGSSFLLIAGILLAIILLLAQGGGYVGGAAVAANAARLGRLPNLFSDDRNGIVVIWGISAVLIPIIREVVVVEAYYAFGFVSAFVITSTTVFFVRNDPLIERGIEPGSAEARSLKFAGLRGMIASYIMMIVLITQKTDALVAIVITGAIITLFQLFMANGGLRQRLKEAAPPIYPPGTRRPEYEMGLQRAHDQARQRGIAHAVEELIESGAMAKFNVGPERIKKLVAYLYNIDNELFEEKEEHEHDDHIEEPNLDLEETYQTAYNQKAHLARHIEHYSHVGIFTFIHNYHRNWVAPEHGRDGTVVKRAMLDILFPMTDNDEIWGEYCAFEPEHLPEPIWQFTRRRYLWAKDQWPNLSDRITTIWTLQDFGLVSKDIDVKMIISVAGGKQFRTVQIDTHSTGVDDEKE
jgi:hypothetical protein